MDLELFNNILNKAKENNFVQNFINELSNHLEETNQLASNQDNNLQANSLKEENCLYQVVEIDSDGAYLQNINDNKICEEKDIPKDILNKIENDTILRYKDGEYIIEEEMTQKFFDSLVGIKEYKDIQESFIRESSILELDSDTRYKVKEFEENDTILIYGNDEKNIIKVPNELIPFFTNSETILYYKDGKFEREV